MRDNRHEQREDGVEQAIEARKRAAAARAAALVDDGMVLGLGTGSTVAHVLTALAARVRDGLRVAGIPSSLATEAVAARLGIPLTTLDAHATLDLTIDGADEVDPALDLIKGAGGALLREKVLAAVSRRLVIVVDDSKLVARLGQRFAVPVEVVPFALPAVARALADLQPLPRRRDGQLVVTDNGNQIVDIRPGPLADPAALADRLARLPGVVDHGLFLGMTSTVIVGRSDGPVTIHQRGETPAW
jgi:ribose 5-phosphate isomerase A